MKIDWYNLPYSHSCPKNIISIFDPSAKVTLPQFIAEMVIFNRTRVIKGYPVILKGPGWSNIIAQQIKPLVQQAQVLYNYFPSIDKEPLVLIAFKNFFRTNKVLKIGSYRKVRVTKAGKLNITEDEKAVIKGISEELRRLIDQREIFSRAVQEAIPLKIEETPAVNKPVAAKVNRFDHLINREKNAGQ